MTLVTCTPYMINSHRLLVRGHRVPYTERTSPKRSRRRTKTMVAQSHDLTHFIALCRKSIPVHSASHT